MEKISIIGAGSWGTTLAVLAAENGYDVTLWVREVAIAKSIIREKENKKYLSGIKIPANVYAESSI